MYRPAHVLMYSTTLLDLADRTEDSEITAEKTKETAAFCLLLPGAILNLSSLLAGKIDMARKEHSLQ